MKLQLFSLGFLVAALLAIVGYVAVAPGAPALGVGIPSIQKSVTTVASTTVSTSIVRVLTANSGRLGAKVCNTSTSTLLFVTTFPASVTATTTVGATGYFVANTGETIGMPGCYVLNQQNMNYGAVWAIRAAGSAAASSEEITASQ